MQLLDSLFLLQQLTPTSDGFTAQLLPQPQHDIYQAHFPGHPITPGVCLQQLVGELCERHCGFALQLSEVKNIKFLATHTPVEGQAVECRVAFDPATLKAQAVFQSAPDSIYAKLSLQYTR